MLNYQYRIRHFTAVVVLYLAVAQVYILMLLNVQFRESLPVQSFPA